MTASTSYIHENPEKEVLFLLNEHFESNCISFKIIVVPYIILFTLSVLLIDAILCLLSLMDFISRICIIFCLSVCIPFSPCICLFLAYSIFNVSHWSQIHCLSVCWYVYLTRFNTLFCFLLQLSQALRYYG